MSLSKAQRHPASTINQFPSIELTSTIIAFHHYFFFTFSYFSTVYRTNTSSALNECYKKISFSYRNGLVISSYTRCTRWLRANFIKFLKRFEWQNGVWQPKIGLFRRPSRYTRFWKSISIFRLGTENSCVVAHRRCILYSGLSFYNREKADNFLESFF